MFRLAVSVVVSAAVGWLGHRTKALTCRGSIAATTVGTAILQRHGLNGAKILGVFFASGSILSKCGSIDKSLLKQGGRDEWQVLANGGVAAATALSGARLSSQQLAALMTGSIAAATSDTWATEIGTRSKQRPRYLLSGMPVPIGVSGGVTPAGTLASVAGAMVIAVIAGAGYRSWRLGAATLLGGVAGSVVDSVFGEIFQATYRDSTCGILTDQDPEPYQWAILESGWPGVGNNLINLACTITGGAIAFMICEFSQLPKTPATFAFDRQAYDPTSS